ncbi:site-specific integrase [Arcticibacter sp. MXS-1]|uniref:site-specific integrase n=1 Tax=Arcticibacter sp. MXS-1 TaxID=3341726 RepID=UPI0035A863F5
MFIGRFQNYLQYEKRYSGYTINAYIKDVEQFALFIGEEEAAFLKARHQDVRAWIVALMEELDARSINRKLSSLRTFYKFLNREGFINSNPMLLVKALKTSKPLPPVVHDAGLSELLDNDTVFSDDFSGLRDRLVLEMLFGTGMRLAELLALKESDVDFYEKRVKVLGKRSKERLIPINATLTAVIRNYIEQKKLRSLIMIH